MSRANSRTVTASDVLLGATVVIAVIGLAATPLAWPHLQTTDAYPLLGLPLAAVLYGWLGWLILAASAIRSAGSCWPRAPARP